MESWSPLLAASVAASTGGRVLSAPPPFSLLNLRHKQNTGEGEGNGTKAASSDGGKEGGSGAVWRPSRFPDSGRRIGGGGIEGEAGRRRWGKARHSPVTVY